MPESDFTREQRAYLARRRARPGRIRGALDADTLENAERFLLQREAYRAEAYDDETGKPVPEGERPRGGLTIGIGHAIRGGEPPGPWPREFADAVLREDVLDNLPKAVSAVGGIRAWRSLTPQQQVAFTSVGYQFGRYSTQEVIRPVLAAIRAGDLDAAARAVESGRLAEYGARAPATAALVRNDTSGMDWRTAEDDRPPPAAAAPPADSPPARSPAAERTQLRETIRQWLAANARRSGPAEIDDAVDYFEQRNAVPPLDRYPSTLDEGGAPPETGVGGQVLDRLSALASGAMRFGQDVSDFIDPNNPVSDLLGAGQQAVRERLSPEKQRNMALREFARQQGPLATGAFLMTTPSEVLDTAIESIPEMIASRGAGGVLRRVPFIGPRLGQTARMTGGEMVTGGAAAAGRAQAEGVDRSRALQTGAEVATLRGALAAGGAALARRRGLADVDTLLYGRPARTSLRRVPGAAMLEGAEEAVEEGGQTWIEDRAAGRDTTVADVLTAGVEGAFAGAGMGAAAGVAGAAAGRAPEPAAVEGGPAEQPQRMRRERPDRPRRMREPKQPRRPKQAEQAPEQVEQAPKQAEQAETPPAPAAGPVEERDARGEHKAPDYQPSPSFAARVERKIRARQKTYEGKDDPDSLHRLQRGDDMVAALANPSRPLRDALNGYEFRRSQTLDVNAVDAAQAVAREVVAQRAAARLRQEGDEAGARRVEGATDRQRQVQWRRADRADDRTPAQRRAEDPAYMERAFMRRWGTPAAERPAAPPAAPPLEAVTAPETPAAEPEDQPPAAAPAAPETPPARAPAAETAPPAPGRVERVNPDGAPAYYRAAGPQGVRQFGRRAQAEAYASQGAREAAAAPEAAADEAAVRDRLAAEPEPPPPAAAPEPEAPAAETAPPAPAVTFGARSTADGRSVVPVYADGRRVGRIVKYGPRRRWIAELQGAPQNAYRTLRDARRAAEGYRPPAPAPDAQAAPETAQDAPAETAPAAPERTAEPAAEPELSDAERRLQPSAEAREGESSVQPGQFDRLIRRRDDRTYRRGGTFRRGAASALLGTEVAQIAAVDRAVERIRDLPAQLGALVRDVLARGITAHLRFDRAVADPEIDLDRRASYLLDVTLSTDRQIATLWGDTFDALAGAADGRQAWNGLLQDGKLNAAAPAAARAAFAEGVQRAARAMKDSGLVSPDTDTDSFDTALRTILRGEPDADTTTQDAALAGIRALQRARRNLGVQEVVESGVVMGDAEQVKRPGRGTITFREDGREVHYRAKPYLVDLVAEDSPAGAGLAFLGRFTRFIRGFLLVRDLGFQATNVLRDLHRSYVNNPEYGAGLGMMFAVRDYLAALPTAYEAAAGSTERRIRAARTEMSAGRRRRQDELDRLERIGWLPAEFRRDYGKAEQAWDDDAAAPDLGALLGADYEAGVGAYARTAGSLIKSFGLPFFEGMMTVGEAASRIARARAFERRHGRPPESGDAADVLAAREETGSPAYGPTYRGLNRTPGTLFQFWQSMVSGTLYDAKVLIDPRTRGAALKKITLSFLAPITFQSAVAAGIGWDEDDDEGAWAAFGRAVQGKPGWKRAGWLSLPLFMYDTNEEGQREMWTLDVPYNPSFAFLSAAVASAFGAWQVGKSAAGAVFDAGAAGLEGLLPGQSIALDVIGDTAALATGRNPTDDRGRPVFDRGQWADLTRIEKGMLMAYYMADRFDAAWTIETPLEFLAGDALQAKRLEAERAGKQLVGIPFLDEAAARFISRPGEGYGRSEEARRAGEAAAEKTLPARRAERTEIARQAREFVEANPEWTSGTALNIRRMAGRAQADLTGTREERRRGASRIARQAFLAYKENRDFAGVLWEQDEERQDAVLRSRAQTAGGADAQRAWVIEAVKAGIIGRQRARGMIAVIESARRGG